MNNNTLIDILAAIHMYVCMYADILYVLIYTNWCQRDNKNTASMNLPYLPGVKYEQHHYSGTIANALLGILQA